MKIDNFKSEFNNHVRIDMFQTPTKTIGGVSNHNIANNAVLYDRPSQPVFAEDALKSVSNDFLKLKLRLKNDPSEESRYTLLEELPDIVGKVVVGKEDDDSLLPKFVRNQTMEVLNSLESKAWDEFFPDFVRNLREDRAMRNFLGFALGLKHIDGSDEGIAKMMDMYRKRLAEGTLKKSDSVELLSAGAFEEYCKNYYDYKAEYKVKYEKYQKFTQRIQDMKSLLLKSFDEQKSADA
ncbi:hypothetical protein AGMMS49975_28080 [Clostridia bacterium]|nr:hypothetical protein AGMMS49975_28080 [Clostridia bacterium]